MADSWWKPNVSSEVAHTSELSHSKLPEWVSKGGQELWEQARLVSQRPYPTYDGPRVAGFNPTQQQAFDLTYQNIGSHRPYTHRSGQLTEQAAQSWTDPGVIDSYTNPYHQAVTDRAKEELNRDFAKQNMAADARAASASAFGGDRHTLLNAEINRNQNLALGDLQLKANQAAYEAARQGFNMDANRQLAAGRQFGQLGQTVAGLGAADASALHAAGAVQQDLTQRSYDTAYQDFLEERNWPHEQINWATGVLQGVPYETAIQNTGQHQQFFQAPSILGQAAGALSALYGGYKLYGNQN